LLQNSLQNFPDLVELLLAHGARVEFTLPAMATLPQLALAWGHLGVSRTLTEAVVSRRAASRGDLPYFQAAALRGQWPAPRAQWEALLPPEQRGALVAWAAAAVCDSCACYAALFRPVEQTRGGSASLPGAAGSEKSAAEGLLRARVAHDGLPIVRRLVVAYLVYPKADTRRLLRELAPKASTGASAAVVAGPAAKRNKVTA
jgi:hypothetical protein